jgi:hypothetical protein
MANTILIIVGLVFATGNSLDNHSRNIFPAKLSSFKTDRRFAIGIAASWTFFSATKGAQATSGGTDRSTGYSIQRTDREWRSSLRSLQYDVLREGGTERPFSSPLEKESRVGVFLCAGCGTSLFSSTEKVKLFHALMPLWLKLR